MLRAILPIRQGINIEKANISSNITLIIGKKRKRSIPTCKRGPRKTTKGER